MLFFKLELIYSIYYTHLLTQTSLESIGRTLYPFAITVYPYNGRLLFGATKEQPLVKASAIKPNITNFLLFITITILMWDWSISKVLYHQQPPTIETVESAWVTEREPVEAELSHFICAIWKHANKNYLDVCSSKFCLTDLPSSSVKDLLRLQLGCRMAVTSLNLCVSVVALKDCKTSLKTTMKHLRDAPNSAE